MRRAADELWRDQQGESLGDNVDSGWQRAQYFSIRLDEREFRRMSEIVAFDGDAFHQLNSGRVGMASEPHGCHESQVTQTAARFECDYF